LSSTWKTWRTIDITNGNRGRKFAANCHRGGQSRANQFKRIVDDLSHCSALRVDSWRAREGNNATDEVTRAMHRFARLLQTGLYRLRLIAFEGRQIDVRGSRSEYC